MELKPILPRLVEVQPDWNDSALYPFTEGSPKSFKNLEGGREGRSGAPSCISCARDQETRCGEGGHLARDCPMRADAQKPICCGGNWKYLTTCHQKLISNTRDAPHDGRPRGKVYVVLGEEPLLPHSVEVQHNWTDAELYLHSSFTFKPAQPLPVKQGAKRKERLKEVESESDEDDEYSF
jgi:hypothetical protein